MKSRREFFKIAALTTGGFMLGSWADAAPEQKVEFVPNAFIKITSEGKITLIAHMPEMGQGVKTSLPMLIAEELEVPWEEVNIETEIIDESVFGKQTAGGSQSVRSNYRRLRVLGAAAKEMLVGAAAEEWGISADQCIADSGTIKNKTNGNSLTYGQLAEKAAKQKAPDPKKVALKNQKDFKIIGKRIPGVDNQAIVTGEPLFGIDQAPEGLVYASYLRCPVFGGEVESANLDEVKSLPGVSDAFIIKGSLAPSNLSGGVAVIANSTWRAMKAKDVLKVKWDTGSHGKESSEEFEKQAIQAIQKKSKGGKGKAQGNLVEATYHYPSLAHNTLEPQNCTAVFKNGAFEIWSPTQAPGLASRGIVRALKVAKNKVKIRVTRSGGGFGRRINGDFTVECAAIAKRLNGVPVKLTWTREQDIQHDFYRSAGWLHFKGSLGEGGKIASWDVHAVVQGANSKKKPGTAAQFSKQTFPKGFVPEHRVNQTILATNTPFGWWRAPASNGQAFAIQSFIDELAHKAGKDPLDFNMDLLGTKGTVGKFDAHRMRGVVQAAAKKANWGKSLPKGSAQGLAYYFSHQGYVAVVAEVSVTKDGELSVNKLTAGVDVGPILNLSGAESQVVGSMLDGLSSAWYQKVQIKDGAVQNSNFDNYPALRMPQVGEAEVVFVESENAPTGLGEPALPPSIPAICNAIFAASGKRIRTLPISDHDLSWS